MIDWKRVDELRGEIGPEDFNEVVALFLEEVESVMVRLDTRPDPATYGADLHFLKGSALNLGFTGFGAQCQIGERLANSGKQDSVDIVGILAAYAKSKDTFMERVAEYGLDVGSAQTG